MHEEENPSDSKGLLECLAGFCLKEGDNVDCLNVGSVFLSLFRGQLSFGTLFSKLINASLRLRIGLKISDSLRLHPG